MGRTTSTVPPPHAFGADLDDTGCSIMHVDMDAFFASVELARRPQLRGKPVIVGGLGARGVVSAASYEARVYGVNSAMPMAVARKRCPHAEFIAPDGAEYSRISKAVMEIFTSYTPQVEPLSIDEAFLDVSGARRLFGSAKQIARQIRAEVAEQHSITCTVGIASTKFVAKLASTHAKPDGLAVVPADEVLTFLHPLPISALWGVGEKTAKVIERLGLRTVADIAQAPLPRLERSLGKATAQHLRALAHGRDHRTVDTTRVEKSISAETTFDVDIDDVSQVCTAALALSRKVAARSRKASLMGYTITVKLRSRDFSTKTRSRTLTEATDVAQEIYSVAAQLVRDNVTSPIRLVGVRLGGLVDARSHAFQPTLDSGRADWRELERTIDGLHTRFGRDAVSVARLVSKAETRARKALEKPWNVWGADKRGKRDDRCEVPAKFLSDPPTGRDI